MDDEKKGCDGSDIALLGPPAEDGGIHVLRHRPDHSIETGVLKPLRDGHPLYGEIVQMTPREDGLGYDVVPIEIPGQGPAMVNNKAYRDGWDTVFNKTKTVVGEA